MTNDHMHIKMRVTVKKTEITYFSLVDFDTTGKSSLLPKSGPVHGVINFTNFRDCYLSYTTFTKKC